ncbi:MAG: hypothetical protein HY961_19220 [Ignavibacteriae bacterium]|nr:hypothetical protein [Ignavibacteriota bacterium]
MFEDPIVEEVHEARRQMWKECGEDIEKYLHMINHLESKDAIRISSVEELKAFKRTQERVIHEGE